MRTKITIGKDKGKGKKGRNNRSHSGLVIMTSFTTIGGQPKVQAEYEESYAIVHGFPCADTTVVPYQLMKLNNDGTVSKVAAKTDVPLGMCASSYRKEDNKVRVYTPFVAVSKCIADGDTVAGDRVCCTGHDATTTFPKAKTTVTAGDYVFGQVLEGATSGGTIVVGFYRVPAIL